MVAVVLAIVKCTHRGTMNGISSGRGGRCSCGGVGGGGSCVFYDCYCCCLSRCH